ncbi:MAG TPA: hypothetical protein VEX41_06605 [Candidatus Eisenbacteria bacterium]|nr:hypothetical protein [Candidatus Eisenbacteria bacterium]
MSQHQRVGWFRAEARPTKRAGRLRGTAALLAGAVAVLAACSSSPLATGVVGATSAPVDGTAGASVPPASIDAATGFAFTADDIVAYYQGQGYACIATEPSTTAAGFFFRSCEKLDDAGRTLVIGLVTDPDGRLAEGFATVSGTQSETVLEPEVALPPLAGFLGATLGEAEGGRAADWLIDHLGGVYEQTTLGRITLATYNGDNDDPAVLAVELANQAYLDAPTPSG